MNKSYLTISQLIMAIVLSALSTTLAAQVYQTADEDGNPVFSDTPSAGASEVEIQTTNTANSVEVRPEPNPPKQKQPKATESSENTAPEHNETLDPYLINSDRDERRRLDRPEHRPENKPERPSTQPAKSARPANRR
jgi:hypothetical protein